MWLQSHSRPPRILHRSHSCNKVQAVRKLEIQPVRVQSTLISTHIQLMATKPKTTKNKASVAGFLASIDNPKRSADARTVIKLMQSITHKRPTMWGTSIVGFGTYHYKYASGREGDSFMTGVSPRKQALTVYIMPGFDDYKDLLSRLGKHKTAKSCLYINKLEDVDLSVLEQLIAKSVREMEKRYG